MNQQESLKNFAINQYSRNQINLPTSNGLLELLVRTDSRSSDSYEPGIFLLDAVGHSLFEAIQKPRRRSLTYEIERSFHLTSRIRQPEQRSQDD
jgi:hypothetical protein